jgi:NADH:ubiquinone oxidoreductase subunit 2 (subunit N)
VLGAAGQAHLSALVVVGVVANIALAVACVRPIAVMYLGDRPPVHAFAAVPARVLIVPAAAALLVIGVGCWPAPLVLAAMRSVATIF